MQNLPPKTLTLKTKGKGKFTFVFEVSFMEDETDEQVQARDSAILNHILNCDKNCNQ